VERVLQEVFERPIPIRCIVSSGKVGAPPDVDSDGIVATALRDLGGEIVDVLINPLTKLRRINMAKGFKGQKGGGGGG
jgi:hypothetical protein